MEGIGRGVSCGINPVTGQGSVNAAPLAASLDSHRQTGAGTFPLFGSHFKRGEFSRLSDYPG